MMDDKTNDFFSEYLGSVAYSSENLFQFLT